MSREKYILPDLISSLEKIRMALEISQSEFAKKLGVSQGYYSDVVNGKSGITARMIIGLVINYPGIDVKSLINNREWSPPIAANMVRENSPPYGKPELPEDVANFVAAIMRLPEEKRQSVLKIVSGIIELDEIK
jgi:transcriptional regulator with XRE-family HTH domain